LTLAGEVLTAGYAKLLRIGNLCTKEAATLREPVANTIQYFLEWLEWALLTETVKPKEVTVEYLDGTGGAILQCLARRHVVVLTAEMVEDLRNTKTGAGIANSELTPVVQAFASYAAYKAHFPSSLIESDSGGDALAASRGGSCVDTALVDTQQTPDDDETDPVAIFKKKFQNAISTRMVDFLYDVLQGSYDEFIDAALSKEPNYLEWRLLQIDGFKKFQEIYRLVQAHQGTVDIGQSAPPAPSTRTLQRYRSNDPEESEEKKNAKLSKEAIDKEPIIIYLGTSP